MSMQGYSHTIIQFVCVCVHVCSVAQSCPTLCDPMDRSLSGSSVHGIPQARILREWVVISSSKGSLPSRDQTHVSQISCIVGRFFITLATGDSHNNMMLAINIPEFFLL